MSQSKRRIAITLTTINIPTVTQDLAQLALNSELSSELPKDTRFDFIIVGDINTPPEVADFCKKVSQKFLNHHFVYLDTETQKKLFEKDTALWAHLPFRSFARRNLGDLFAYREGYDAVIRIDDDNFPVQGESFFKLHAHVGQEHTLQELSSQTGWFNVCSLLEEEKNLTFYPRGFPYEKRWLEEKISTQNIKAKMAIHAGLWLGDPDIDAVTRVHRKINATRYKKEVYGKQFFLAPLTWCPINTQNTSFARHTLPAAFVSPHAGRYDDILSGYFLRKIVDHLGERVSYGQPLLNQIRNAHNLWKDLELELSGNKTVFDLISFIQNLNLKHKTYAECYVELIETCQKDFKKLPEYYTKIFDGMKTWAQCFLS